MHFFLACLPKDSFNKLERAMSGIATAQNATAGLTRYIYHHFLSSSLTSVSCKGTANTNTHTPVNTHTHTFPARKAHLSADSYLNLGCLLIASSGKNSDLVTELSTGFGRYSGVVKPGQPNLHSRQLQQKMKNKITKKYSCPPTVS